MIGRWKRWRACSGRCNLWSWEEMWRMFWAGKKVGMTFFLLNPSIAPSQGPLVILFLGAVFGGIGLRWGWVFFAWEASWNRILIINLLKRRGWNMPSRCYLCKEKEETNDHLILFCKKATILWSLIFSLFGVQWVLHSSVKKNLLDWHGTFVGKRREKA